MKILKQVIIISLLWLLVVNSGRPTGDTLRRLDMSHDWWTGTSEVIIPVDYKKPKTRLDGNVGILGSNGKRYIGDDLGQSMLMLPGDWLGTQISQVFPKLGSNFTRRLVVSFVIFLPLNLAAIVACFYLLRLFDFSEKIAGLTSLIFLLCTTFLHYAQIHQQNNQVLLCILIAYIYILQAFKTNRYELLFFSGLALGFSLLLRLVNIIHILTVFGFLISCCIYQIPERVKIVKLVLIEIAGVIPFFLLSRIFNYLRFGNFWTSGQAIASERINSDPLLSGLPLLPANYPFILSPKTGIWGVLFSPAKSIFIYDPLLIPCLIICIFYWRKFSPYIKLYILSVVCDLLLFVVFTSKLDFWHGDPGWGARYHVTSVHLILIPLLAFLIQYLLSLKNYQRWLIRGILALALVVQLLSLVFRPVAETSSIYFAKPESFNNFRLVTRINNIVCVFNPSLSSKCSAKLIGDESLQTKLNLLPFLLTKSRNVIWPLWLGFLLAAVIMTFNFCRTLKRSPQSISDGL